MRLLPSGLCAACAGLLLACGCAGSATASSQRFALRPIVWLDADQQPFEPRPEPTSEVLYWDAINESLFRPLVDVLAVRVGHEAVNVNALDEVPNSSWFVNRVSTLTEAQAAQGPCRKPPLDPQGPWTITGSKATGANPGFFVQGPDGDEYLIKFDFSIQPDRATAADVVGSRLYWAAGFETPCNQIVYFRPEILRIAPSATAQTETGDEVPFSEHHKQEALREAVRLADGRYRAMASRLIEGEPLGPFCYSGRRRGDRNDVIAHEDRRELRGSYVQAAWLDRYDARDANTMSTWIETQHGGYVRHYVFDFGEGLGSITRKRSLSARRGHAYTFHLRQIAEDFATLGAIDRPWEGASFGLSGAVFAYYDVQRFDPGAWYPSYPNPAFDRMTDRDAAWMARIVARITPAMIEAIVREAKLERPLWHNELVRILQGRRSKILARWLEHLSPLAEPVVRLAGGRVRLCMQDLSTWAGVVAPQQRTYQALANLEGDSQQALVPQRLADHRVCLELPAIPDASVERPRYAMIDVITSRHDGGTPAVARVHLYCLGPLDYRVVGLERLKSG